MVPTSILGDRTSSGVCAQHADPTDKDDTSTPSQEQSLCIGTSPRTQGPSTVSVDSPGRGRTLVNHRMAAGSGGLSSHREASFCALDVVLTSQCCTAISLHEGGFHLGPGRGGVTNYHLCAGRVVPSRAPQRRSLTRAAARTICDTDWTRGRSRPIRTYPLTPHPARFRFPSMPWWLARSQAVIDLPTGT